LKEFLRRKEIGDKQREAYLATWGDEPGVWSTQYREILLEVGMKGGKNFWAEGEVAYLCYFIIFPKILIPHTFTPPCL